MLPDARFEMLLIPRVCAALHAAAPAVYLVGSLGLLVWRRLRRALTPAIGETTKTSMHPGLNGEPLTRVPLTNLVGVEIDECRAVSFDELQFSDDALWTLQLGLKHRPGCPQLEANLRS